MSAMRTPQCGHCHDSDCCARRRRSSGEWSNRSEELSAFTAAGHLTEPTKSTKRAVPSAKVKAPWGDKAAPGGELPKDLTKHAVARRQGPFAAGLALLKGEPKADWTA